MRTSSFFLIPITLFAFLMGCGLEGPPLPPEDFAPKDVTILETKTDAEGVILRWRSPDVDSKGDPLESLEGYIVYKREAPDILAWDRSNSEFTELTRISDPALAEVMELRKKAREEKKLSRKIKVPEERKFFEFKDKNVQKGKTYFYKVTPYNQGGVAGKASDFVKVLFNDDTSEIFTIANREPEKG